MSKEVVETVYGKYHKFEVVKDSGVISSIKFYVKSTDGKKQSGTFDRLDKAVEWAKNQG